MTYFRSLRIWIHLYCSRPRSRQSCARATHHLGKQFFGLYGFVHIVPCSLGLFHRGVAEVIVFSASCNYS